MGVSNSKVVVVAEERRMTDTSTVIVCVMSCSFSPATRRAPHVRLRDKLPNAVNIKSPTVCACACACACVCVCVCVRELEQAHECVVCVSKHTRVCMCVGRCVCTFAIAIACASSYLQRGRQWSQPVRVRVSVSERARACVVCVSMHLC